jgi:hypothetical protein
MGRFTAGYAERELRLETGQPLAGYGVENRPLTGVHDPLKAKCLAVSAGGDTLALVSVDLLNVSRELHGRVTRAAGDAVDGVLLAATHTHAGPYVAAAAFDMDPYHHMGQDDEAVGLIEEDIAEAVRAAAAARGPATLRVGQATNDTAAVNRRNEGGVVGTIRVPTGEVDPELVALDVTTADGEEVVVFNYACHPVCTTPDETLASADWPGYACREVAEAKDAAVMYLNGAAADINPAGWGATEHDDDPYQHMETIGTDVAGTVREALADAREGDPRSETTVFADSRELRLPLKETPERATLRRRRDELEEEIAALDGEDGLVDQMEATKRYVEILLAVDEWPGSSLPCRLGYYEFADVGVLGLPGEIFVDHGLAFKRRAAVDHLLPVGYADGYVGYVPTLAALENGDYEVDVMKVAPDAVSTVREAALSLVSTDGGDGYGS